MVATDAIARTGTDPGAGRTWPSIEVIAQYRQRIKLASMPSQVRQEAHRHLARLEVVPVDSFEHYMVRGYLEAVIEMPWAERAASERHLLNAAYMASR